MNLPISLRQIRPARVALILLSILVLLVVILGLRWWLLGTFPPEGLPRGFAKQRLVELDIAGTKIRSLKGLPPTLQVLDVSYTDVESLASVPEDLKELDIRETGIEHLTGLPPHLEVLKLGNRKILRLGNLPDSLQDLHLENTGIRDLTGVPPRLRTLYVKGESLENLDGLPGTLQSLTLESTRVKSLKNLPSALQGLELIANRDLRFTVDELPPLLTRLEIDHEQIYLDEHLNENEKTPVKGEKVSTKIEQLRYLSWFSDRRRSPIRAYPGFLSSLTLRLSDGLDSRDLQTLPRSLRALSLLNASLSLPGNFPPELEVLDLTGYSKPDLESLRSLASLRRLDLAYSSVEKVPELPATLDTLVLTGTKVADLRGLPSGLKTLVFGESDFGNLDGSNLPRSLTRLDFSNSRSLQEISFLPKGLTYLNLSGTGIKSLPTLGDHLQDLDLSNTEIKNIDLRSLPRSLKVLTLSEGQIKNLEGLPPSVDTLRFVRRMKAE
jgi:hypothetical protein